LAEDRDPANCRARDVMTAGVLYCYDDEDVGAAGRSMREKQVRRLPVVNREKRLVGIVSLGDLAVTTNEKVAGTALRGVSEERGQPAPARSH
jgi:CBS-domain-containing membrane protein